MVVKSLIVYPNLKKIKLVIPYTARIVTGTGPQFLHQSQYQKHQELKARLKKVFPNVESFDYELFPNHFPISAMIDMAFLGTVQAQQQQFQHRMVIGAVMAAEFGNPLKTLSISHFDPFVVDYLEENYVNLEKLALTIYDANPSSNSRSNHSNTALGIQKLLGVSSMTKLWEIDIRMGYSNPTISLFESIFKTQSSHVVQEVGQELDYGSNSLSPANVIDVGQTNIKSIKFKYMETSPRILYLLEKFPKLERVAIILAEITTDIESVAKSVVQLPSVVILHLSFAYKFHPDIKYLKIFIGLFPNVKIVEIDALLQETLRELKIGFPDILFLEQKRAFAH
ncbi:hypothetical protein H4219_004697 [Mycoemilia scoparia]|uniref:Uncharacterized protein n=1 Tax=Mycoemilia scoparia TaxID=417184 RepID=A0A9W8DQX7_9FUNG|nr:hypothetical protein H4219_004697 [Mycoemilia scoparia]